MLLNFSETKASLDLPAEEIQRSQGPPAAQRDILHAVNAEIHLFPEKSLLNLFMKSPFPPTSLSGGCWILSPVVVILTNSTPTPGCTDSILPLTHWLCVRASLLHEYQALITLTYHEIDISICCNFFFSQAGNPKIEIQVLNMFRSFVILSLGFVSCFVFRISNL